MMAVDGFQQALDRQHDRVIAAERDDARVRDLVEGGRRERGRYDSLVQQHPVALFHLLERVCVSRPVVSSIYSKLAYPPNCA